MSDKTLLEITSSSKYCRSAIDSGILAMGAKEPTVIDLCQHYKQASHSSVIAFKFGKRSRVAAPFKYGKEVGAFEHFLECI